jgi:outer membrane protein assembly factor BamB
MNPLRVVVYCLLLTFPAQAQNWPSFRGPNNSGIADQQNLPTEWSLKTSENVLWRTAIPGLAHSSPVVWENRVFLTTAVMLEGSPDLEVGRVSGGKLATDESSRHSWRLYALDKRTGIILWQKTAHEGIPRSKRHVKASHASATPVTNGKYIVALFGSEGLFCYDRDGNLLWQKDLGLIDSGYVADPSLQWGPASSPIIYRELVSVQNDHNGQSFLAAYQIQTGEEVWKVERNEKPAWSTPVVYSGERVELVTNSANFLYGYDPTTGEELWRFDNGDSQVVIPSPVIADNLVVLTGGAPRNERPIFAIRLGGNGDISLTEGEGTSENVAWKTRRGSPYTPTPLIYRGLVYSCANNGILSVYDFSTGERRYRVRVGVGATFSASPVGSDGKVYFAGEDGEVYVVKAGPEYELLSTNPMEEVLMATPAISDGMLVIRSRNQVYGIGSKSETQATAARQQGSMP